ncbi:MAG: GNAT family N-acetyltransferase [Paludibacteraceae bacterium]|nr:GNAT family N-acetyltransferase [Paludibacteraceae bacterium]
MEDIIAPVPTKLIEEELSKDVFLRTTNKGGNEIYIVSAKNAPNTLREIGRLREVSFRAAGGGAGVSCDIDKYDTMERPYHQLIVWNPEEKEIIGGYRYLHGCEATFQPNGQPNLTSSHLFIYSDKFIKDYLPYTIELGRSFVRPEYQSSKKGAKSLYALDNLWDGLGALTLTIPNTKYFFGKATIYPSFNEESRNCIFAFLKKYFADKENLVYPRHPFDIDKACNEFEKILTGDSFKEDYTILKSYVKKTGHNIPPLINAYMSLSPTMKTFGSCINDEFGEVIETGLMITIEEIFEQKRVRHVDTFLAAQREAKTI